MQTLSLDSSPLVRAAVVALDAFGALDRGAAAELLTMWSRRPGMTSQEVMAVLDHFPRAVDDPEDGDR